MKLNQLANKYLEYMVKSYSKTHKRIFGWDEIRNLYPNEDEEFICDAFRKLSYDGLTNNFWADNVVDSTELLVNAVSEAEENTRLKKVYEFLKEVRSWI